MNMFEKTIMHRQTKELIRELRCLSASEEIAEQAAAKIENLEIAFDAQRNAAMAYSLQCDYIKQFLAELKADIYRSERAGLESAIDKAIMTLTVGEYKMPDDVAP